MKKREALFKIQTRTKKKEALFNYLILTSNPPSRGDIFPIGSGNKVTSVSEKISLLTLRKGLYISCMSLLRHDESMY